MDYMLIRFFEFLLFTSQLDDSSRETKKAPAGASTWAISTWPVSTLKKKGSQPNRIKDWTGSCSTNKNAPSKLKPQTWPDLLQSDKWEEKKWCEIRSTNMQCFVLLSYFHFDQCLQSILKLHPLHPRVKSQEWRQWIQTTEHWIWLKFPNKKQIHSSLHFLLTLRISPT